MISHSTLTEIIDCVTSMKYIGEKSQLKKRLFILGFIFKTPFFEKIKEFIAPSCPSQYILISHSIYKFRLCLFEITKLETRLCIGWKFSHNIAVPSETEHFKLLKMLCSGSYRCILMQFCSILNSVVTLNTFIYTYNNHFTL